MRGEQLRYKNLTIASLLVGVFWVAAISTAAAFQGQLSLHELQGEWKSESPAFGNPARSNMRWTPVFGGKFLKLDYRISETETDNPVFTGVAYYAISDDRTLRAMWVDSNGDILQVRAEVRGRSITARWGRPGEKEGETVYELSDENMMIVTDRIKNDGEWIQLNEMEFAKIPTSRRVADKERLVTGIGGLFFRGKDPVALATWYERHFAINPAPTDINQEPWRQDEGYTVFSPFEASTDYFGDPEKQWMINLRVRDLDRLIAQLRANGIEVSDPISYPHGRFARLSDPENNPIELWEPVEPVE